MRACRGLRCSEIEFRGLAPSAENISTAVEARSQIIGSGYPLLNMVSLWRKINLKTHPTSDLAFESDVGHDQDWDRDYLFNLTGDLAKLVYASDPNLFCEKMAEISNVIKILTSTVAAQFESDLSEVVKQIGDKDGLLTKLDP